MYSLLIDRFFDGDPSNSKKLNSPNVLPKVDYFGGDLKGVLEKLNQASLTILVLIQSGSHL